MLRKFHGLPGLLAGLLLMVLSVTGAVLALAPALDRASAVVPASGDVSVAELAGRVVAQYPGTEQIVREPSGKVIVYYSRDGQVGADLVNPLTGEGIAPYESSAFFGWVKDLHRSLMLDDAGRALAGVMAALMGLLCVSGMLLLARRIGGWKNLLRPFSGSGSKRVHAELARFAVLGLLLSALTGSYMSAQRFGLLPEASATGPGFPAEVSGGQPAPVGTLNALGNVDLGEFRELVFPYPGDPQDVYSLTTTGGSGFVDQATGELLQYQPRSEGSIVQQWIVSLHTGEGLWWLGLILGAAALTVPVLSVTGMTIWWQRRRSPGKLPDNADASLADTIILVGSEGNTTWGFARELHASLNKAGFHVHCSEMNALADRYPQASRLFVLTSTYGDGDAPASARRFMARLGNFRPGKALKFAVLGFGDRQFSNFCKFAVDVDAALADKGLSRLHTVERIDRCSSPQFREWGEKISEEIGVPLALDYSPLPPATVELELIERADYGLAVQAPTSILRFKAAEPGGWRKYLPSNHKTLPAFEAGDLLGVMPPNGQAPRFYSLASSATDGVLEICVRKQPGGLCSGYLHELRPGDRIEGFVRENPDFRPAKGSNPVILIGAGAGIGPLAGFIRKNTSRSPMYLYWGGRSSQSDFLYKPELRHYLDDHRLTGLNTAFSRSDERAYVQDKLRQDESAVRQMVSTGAQILVCGGRDMAAGVRQVIDDILKPLATDVKMLKAQGRYLEDIY
ncbi:PepSY domain-containing protein [Halomonas vilamensis]|uniref:NADPH--hemoprotein reductase n=1 Tax=Vreelandella vilamensis TaxID=531309 RepID=A0ABU1H6X3_9GAMM|nr:PepSY domain-containing protein [Halomonas vilamensis]MDR5900048.1 PepSY domain-containing protein [Halomonas vilamensis]